MFTRLLIRLRWPTAILAALSLFAMVLSGWFRAEAEIAFGTHGPSVGSYIHSGTLMLSWSRADTVLAPKVVAYTVWPATVQWYWSWWDFGAEDNDWAINAWAPLWTVTLFLMALAVIGFCSASQQLKLGWCKGCRYPLEGASICPECGRSALSN